MNGIVEGDGRQSSSWRPTAASCSESARAGTSRHGESRNRGPTVPGGDGLLLDRGRLVVVQGSPAALAFLKLAGTATLKAVADAAIKLRGPRRSPRAEALLVVNADFATSPRPFTVAGLPRGGDD